MTITEFVEEIKKEKDHVVKMLRRLREHNPYDHYWKELLELSDHEDFFEPCLLQYWIGKKIKPERILEIGTRTGGSLVSLLSSYSEYKNTEVYSFDLWVENIHASFLSKIPLLRSLIKVLPANRSLAVNMVKQNLRLFSIPPSIVTFISGDSKNTVPSFFRDKPNLQFDYISVDGAHDPTTAYTDLNNVAAFIAPKGFLIFDDISPEGYNLLPVWEKFKEKYKNDFTFYETMHRKGLAWAIRI